jgi:hypothetical protein
MRWIFRFYINYTTAINRYEIYRKNMIFWGYKQVRNPREESHPEGMTFGASQPHPYAGWSPVSTSRPSSTLSPFLHSSMIRSHIFQIHSHIPSYGASRDKILTPAARWTPYINRPLPTSFLIPSKPPLSHSRAILLFRLNGQKRDHPFWSRPQ